MLLVTWRNFVYCACIQTSSSSRVTGNVFVDATAYGRTREVFAVCGVVRVVAGDEDTIIAIPRGRVSLIVGSGV